MVDSDMNNMLDWIMSIIWSICHMHGVTVLQKTPEKSCMLNTPQTIDNVRHFIGSTYWFSLISYVVA